MRGSIKKVFPGGNTSEGFFSYYRYLLEKGTKRVFVIKGGPGVGKSTLMKKIGQKMLEFGYNVEFHHCSSDNNSLDGIAILEAGIVMVDGTAPHIVDPKYPGGLDEIINMGEFWDVDAMQTNMDRIIASTNEVSRLFARAYRFLGSSKALADNIIAMYQQCMNFAAVNKVTGILDKVLLDNTYLPEAYDSLGNERHLFSCAYTPEGFVDFTDSILNDIRRVYYIKGPMGTGKSTLMKKIAASAVEKGLDVEIYHTPLVPQKMGSVVIKSLGFAITSSDKFQEKNYETINLNQYLDKGMIAGYEREIQSDTRLMEELISKGIANIRKAKDEHDSLEQYYVPHMNFAAAEEKYEEILSRILGIAESSVTAASARIYN
ncbi:MAG: ATPase [Peptococcaceae bacterium]|nr:ATPase [Peptococcaceae bacterium]